MDISGVHLARVINQRRFRGFLEARRYSGNNNRNRIIRPLTMLHSGDYCYEGCLCHGICTLSPSSACQLTTSCFEHSLVCIATFHVHDDAQRSKRTCSVVLSVEQLANGLQLFASFTPPHQSCVSGGNSSSYPRRDLFFPFPTPRVPTDLPINSSLQHFTLASFPAAPNDNPRSEPSVSTLNTRVLFLAQRRPKLCPYTAERQTLSATFVVKTTSPARRLCSVARKSSFSSTRECCESRGGSQKLTLKPARVSSPSTRSKISIVAARRRSFTLRGCETEMTAQRRLIVIVCGEMERMCEAGGICLMSVRGRLLGSCCFVGDLESSDTSEIGRDVSEAKDNVVELRNVVSSTAVGAICEDTRSSIRAIECSRKSCFVAMSSSGSWSLKEKNCV